MKFITSKFLQYNKLSDHFLFLLVTLILFVQTITIREVSARSLLQERIRKMTPSKLSVYLQQGIVFKSGGGPSSTLNSVRHFYTDKVGYERLVFDFNSGSVPSVYSYLSPEEKKIYLDLLNTKLNPSFSSSGESVFIKKMDLFPIDQDLVTIELNLKTSGQFDIFYLENPGRLVVDIKKDE